MDLSKRDQQPNIPRHSPVPGPPSEFGEDEECPVCLDPILPSSTIGTIQSCSHYYHETCIRTWSLHSNSCPTCRRLYRKVDILVKSRPQVKLHLLTVQDRIPANDAIESIPSEYVQSAGSSTVGGSSSFPAPASSETNPNAAGSASMADYAGSVCTICTSSQYRPTWKMMSCTQCLSSFHSRCLGVRANIDIWYCPICDSEQVAPPTGPIATAGTSIRSLASIMGETRRRRVTPSLNSRITEAVFRNPASSSLYIGSTSSSSSDYVRSSAFGGSGGGPPRSRRSGLVIFNNNDELEANFDQDDEESRPDVPSLLVFNGGVLRRRELRQTELLSPEESQSWDSFMRAKEINSGDAPALGQEPVPELTASSSRSLEAKKDEAPKRRRRRKITRGVEDKEVDLQSASTTATSGAGAGGYSRISLLISQMRAPSQSRVPPLHLHPSLSTSISISSSAQESSDGSPHALSPDVVMVDSDSSCPSEEDLTSKRVCRSDSSSTVVSSAPDISLEQKNLIQFHIRNHLRPMYKPNSPDSSQTITKESEYIEINKNLSRQIYRRILGLSDRESIFENLDALRKLVDEVVSRWKVGYTGST